MCQLASMNPDDMSYALAYLAEYSPGGSPAIHVANSILWGDLGVPGYEELIIVDATPTFAHSIVMGSGGSASWNSAFGTDQGGNLDQDPVIAALTYSFGVTWIYLPGAGSPAIDAGLDAQCPDSDQRGVLRPQGAHCDIGSVEVEP